MLHKDQTDKCPKCESEDLEGNEYDEEYEYPKIYLPVKCLKCGFQFIEIYKQISWMSKEEYED